MTSSNNQTLGWAGTTAPTAAPSTPRTTPWASRRARAAPAWSPGLYYDQARWYSAPQGRFLTPDPSGAAGGLNLNAYCGNDPVNQTDPTGLNPTLSSADEANIQFVMQNRHISRGQAISGLVEEGFLDQDAGVAASQALAASLQTRRNAFAAYGFCSVCHGSADGRWVDLASGLDHRPIPLDQLRALQIANATSEYLSPYAEGGVKIASSVGEAIGGLLLAPVSGGASLSLLWFASDDFTTGVRTIVDHRSTNSVTHEAIFNYAFAFGADADTADTIGTVGDIGLRLASAGQGFYASWRAARAGGTLGLANGGSRVSMAGASLELPSENLAGNMRFVAPKTAINPTGCSTNCVNLALAQELRFRGIPAIAAPSEGGNLINSVEFVFGVSGKAYAGSTSALQDALAFALANDGDTAIIGTAPPLGLDEGHAFNAVNVNGVVYIVDGQFDLRIPLYSHQFYNYADDYPSFSILLPGNKP